MFLRVTEAAVDASTPASTRTSSSHSRFKDGRRISQVYKGKQAVMFLHTHFKYATDRKAPEARYQSGGTAPRNHQCHRVARRHPQLSGKRSAQDDVITSRDKFVKPTGDEIFTDLGYGALLLGQNAADENCLQPRAVAQHALYLDERRCPCDIGIFRDALCKGLPVFQSVARAADRNM